MSLHANRMYETLTDSNIDDSLDRFNECAPNKFMRTFAAMSYLVHVWRQNYRGKSTI